MDIMNSISPGKDGYESSASGSRTVPRKNEGANALLLFRQSGQSAVQPLVRRDRISVCDYIAICRMAILQNARSVGLLKSFLHVHESNRLNDLCVES